MRIIATALAILLSTGCFSQGTQDETTVREVIDKLFLAMQKGDSTMLKECFGPEVTLATIYRNKSGEPTIERETSIGSFSKAVGTPRKEVWFEEIWSLKIDVDGDFASAWCDYAFYRDNIFSHCGVDAFHFFKGKEGWKIIHLTDTRRKTGCNVPDAIQQKHR
jgi:hypothetical protein